MGVWVSGETERRALPVKDYSPFEAEAAYYRLFCKEQQTVFMALA
jgi:hypothetical protein